MEFTDKALILKVGRFRENDLWVRFFSPAQGVLTAFAFGGCRSRRRFCGCLDALNQVLFRVRRGRAEGYLCLTEGVLLASPARLRSDWRRLGLAANCLKFAEAAHPGPLGAERAFGLCVETLAALETAADVPALFPFLFRARMLFEQGVGPDVRSCAGCGRPLGAAAGARLLLERGRLVCPVCPGGEGTPLPVGGAALEILDFVRTATPEEWLRLRLPPEVRRDCARAVDGVVRYHLGLAWEHGRFRRV